MHKARRASKSCFLLLPLGLGTRPLRESTGSHTRHHYGKTTLLWCVKAKTGGGGFCLIQDSLGMGKLVMVPLLSLGSIVSNLSSWG